MINTELDSTSSKISRVKGEFQRFFSIFILPSTNDADDSFEAIKANVANKDDIKIIDELEKSSKKLEQDAVNFLEGVGTYTKQKKEKVAKSNSAEVKINIKPASIEKTANKKTKDIER